MASRLNLAHCLGLNPLDRLQINSATERREQKAWGRLHGAQPDLPYWYFQFVDCDGLLYVRAPNGYSNRIDPLDVCDVVRAEPIEVSAMPVARFLDWLRLPCSQRTHQDPAYYAPARVLAVQKDRWGRVDQVYVRFKDTALNHQNVGTTYAAPVLNADRERLRSLARRTRMPVMSPARAGNYSAELGIRQHQERARQSVRRFIQASIAGDVRTASRLLCTAGVAQP